MSEKKLKVGVVGLSFGGAFPPIYRDHPDVESVVLCEKNEPMMREYARQFRFDQTTNDFDALCESDVDAIHIITGIPNHAELVVKALRAGKNVACTVPMATSMEDIYAILEAQKASGKTYMMMETSMYTFQCFYVKKLIDEGKMGRLQYLRGTHFQDMEAWPKYWDGLPPFWYATHAVAPLLYLSDSYATAVTAFGSGVMRDALTEQYNNPFPIEHAMIELNKPNLMAEITRSLFATAINYVEGFTIFGEKQSFEWNIENEQPILHETVSDEDQGKYHLGRAMKMSRIEYPDTGDILPESIRAYTHTRVLADPDDPTKEILTGGGHHGAHPHMVHEFVRSILEGRKPVTDAVTAARWCAVGICAHQSALQGGKRIEVPDFKEYQ